MSAAREEILRRIARALADDPSVPPVPRAYRQRGELPAAEVVSRFAARVRETGAEVVLTPSPRQAIEDALARHAAPRVGIPTGLAANLRPGGVELVEDRALPPRELDALDAAVTASRAACADTGTIALDGGDGQGRRALSLVPDLHVCLVSAGDVVETVPDLMAILEPSARAGRPIVLVSGPSATSDIELRRVEGVHGPRRLVVILATQP